MEPPKSSYRYFCIMTVYILRIFKMGGHTVRTRLEQLTLAAANSVLVWNHLSVLIVIFVSWLSAYVFQNGVVRSAMMLCTLYLSMAGTAPNFSVGRQKTDFFIAKNPTFCIGFVIFFWYKNEIFQRTKILSKPPKKLMYKATKKTNSTFQVL